MGGRNPKLLIAMAILEKTDLECLSEHNNSPIDIALKVVEENVKLRESLDYLDGSRS